MKFNFLFFFIFVSHSLQGTQSILLDKIYVLVEDQLYKRKNISLEKNRNRMLSPIQEIKIEEDGSFLVGQKVYVRINNELLEATIQAHNDDESYRAEVIIFHEKECTLECESDCSCEDENEEVVEIKNITFAQIIPFLHLKELTRSLKKKEVVITIENITGDKKRKIIQEQGRIKQVLACNEEGEPTLYLVVFSVDNTMCEREVPANSITFIKKEKVG